MTKYCFKIASVQHTKSAIWFTLQCRDRYVNVVMLREEGKLPLVSNM